MIISYKNRFIFIHCRKTAGSSISMLLSRYLGPRDIQLSALSETLDGGGKVTSRAYWDAAKNAYIALPFLFSRERRWQDIFAMCAKRAYRRQLGPKPQHSNAETIAKAFPNEWSNFTKFCVIRNPFTLAVSDYNWRTRHLRSRPGFIDYLEALRAGDRLGGLVPVEFYNNWRQYTIEGRLVVDRVIRYENLSEKLKEVLSALGISFGVDLPHLKNIKAMSENSSAYRGYYTPKAIALVSELYRDEINAFGYKFEDIE